jgi:hypothetical protein
MGLRPLTLLLGMAAAVGAWALTEDASPIALLVLGAYIASPWAFLALGASSLGGRGRAIALGVFATLTLVTYYSVATSESSTEALVFVVVPLYQWVAVGLIWLISSKLAVRSR